MTVRFDTDAAILPLLGAFGEPVRLSGDPAVGPVVLAIVDFAQVGDDAPFGKPVQSNNWHLTMWADHACLVSNGDTLVSRTASYRVRHCIPEGEGLSTVVATRIDKMGEVGLVITELKPSGLLPKGAIALLLDGGSVLLLEDGAALLLESSA